MKQILSNESQNRKTFTITCDCGCNFKYDESEVMYIGFGIPCKVTCPKCGRELIHNLDKESIMSL